MIYNIRYTSLEGLEINVIAMTFGCLTYALVYGLNWIYMVNSHRGDFLIPLLLQTLILSYMAGRFRIKLASFYSLIAATMHISFSISFSIEYFHFNSLLSCCSRCGEDERPLNELLVLQLAAEHPNGLNNTSRCKVFGTYWNQEKKTILGDGADINSVTVKSSCSNFVSSNK